MILVGSRSGQVTWLGVADGSIQGRYQVIAIGGGGGGGAITGLLLLEPDSYLSTDEDIEARDCIDILVSASDGQVLCLNTSNTSQSEDGSCRAVMFNIAGRFQLPAPSFSTIVYGQIAANRGAIYVGCRDDHLLLSTHA
ncbi:hypothetical protein Ndes2526B_g08566 [Nannochloris sp. 'desiccata']|nr:hypothetical protein KSW81_001839 [Chlorella desiccata (nom. nud.)]KAH7616280.1 hypothetical protein NADE_001103 [Chlorella desiccata (nom. nud.)]KAH7616474.1 hypothetical protein NADE_001292 [Chlorella desiccata (nom. nud.)]